MSDLAAIVREQLGLAPDADEDAVTAALAALKVKAETPAEPPAPPAPDAPAVVEAQPVTASAADLERIVTERVNAAVKPFEVKLEQTTKELADRREAERVETRDRLLASAVKAGKVTPAEVEGLRADYDLSPQDAAAITRMLGRVHAGAAVPVAPAGHTSGEEPAGDAFTDADRLALFGETPKAASI